MHVQYDVKHEFEFELIIIWSRTSVFNFHCLESLRVLYRFIMGVQYQLKSPLWLVVMIGTGLLHYSLNKAFNEFGAGQK